MILLDSAMEKEMESFFCFLNGELETQTQRHWIPPFPQDLLHLMWSYP